MVKAFQRWMFFVFCFQLSKTFSREFLAKKDFASALLKLSLPVFLLSFLIFA